jgi:hypothetical protein
MSTNTSRSTQSGMRGVLEKWWWVEELYSVLGFFARAASAGHFADDAAAAGSAATGGLLGAAAWSTAVFEKFGELAGGDRLLVGIDELVELLFESGIDFVKEMEVKRAAVEQWFDFQEHS